MNHVRQLLAGSVSPRHAVMWRYVLLALLAGMVGCQRRESTPPSAAADADTDQVARTECVRGPVRVAVEFAPHPARLSDEPTLCLTIDYQRGVTVEKPPFGDTVSGFVVRDFHEPLPESKGDREIVRQIYTLEPTRTGKLPIDPITVSFTDTRPDGDGQKHTLETESLWVDVTSVVGSKTPSLADLQPRAGPVELPRSAASPFWWLLPAALVAGAGGLIVWWRRYRLREALVKPLSPRELAYQELQQLIENGFAGGNVKLFYVHLTGIVRRYIERTTGIRAPEQTTEEFLHEISAGKIFTGDERQRLRGFLEAADLVKYAAHEPGPADVEAAFARAQVFMGLARPTEVAA